jgi:uncharacterized membrane protein
MRLLAASRARLRSRPVASRAGLSPSLPPLVIDRREAAALSDEMRTGTDPSLVRRRRIVALELGAAAAMGIAAAYQTGVIARVPEPNVPGFDADKVDASAEAYQLLGMPDATLGLLSYATTLALAAAGGATRDRPRWLSVALAAKASVDAAYAGKLTADQMTKHKALCSWCLVAAAASFAAAPIAWRDLKEGVS